MRIAGIIAEYDPFHNGHAYHIARTRAETGCDFVVVCMDGHFTQRGAPSLFSRWDRARMALSCGADAVFEQPTLFAARTADVFAQSGAAILGGLGCDILSFGCETEDISLIERFASLKDHEPDDFKAALAAYLSQGMSHAAAYGRAAAGCLNTDAEALNRPNLILAAEYVRALHKQRLPMSVHPVLRKGDYHDERLHEYASASAIRSAWRKGDYESALSCIPEKAHPFLPKTERHALDDVLLYRLRGMSREAWLRIPDVSEGLENLLMKQCRLCPDAESLIEAVKSKRYTRSRISRILTCALLGLDAGFIQAHPVPVYARLIGARTDAAPLLRELKARSSLPIVSNASELKGDPVFGFECRCTDLWALSGSDAQSRAAGREYTEKFIRL